MKIKMPAREDAAIDMAPMIDMVFLLLVFFMVASIAAQTRVEIEALPQSAHAKVPEDIKDRTIISIDVDGNYYVDMDEMDLGKVQEYVARKMEQNPNQRILIRADERVEYKLCRELMEACGEVGATDLIYSAFEA